MALKGSPITVGTAQTTLVTMPSNKEGAVHGLQIGNTTGSNINISFTYTDSSASADVSFLTTTVSGNSTFTFSKPINLNGNDSMKASASQSGLVAIASVFEDTTVNVASLGAAGEYTATVTYNFGDLVTDGSGNTFLSTFDGNVNRGIDNSSAFQTFASKGDQGDITAAGTATLTNKTFGDATTFNSTVSDQDGDLRDIPLSGSIKSDAYTLAIGDAGNHVVFNSANVNFTVPASVFDKGDIVSIISTKGATATVSSGITNMFVAEGASATATATIGANGVASILFLSASYAVLTGNVT